MITIENTKPLVINKPIIVSDAEIFKNACITVNSDVMYEYEATVKTKDGIVRIFPTYSSIYDEEAYREFLKTNYPKFEVVSIKINKKRSYGKICKEFR